MLIRNEQQKVMARKGQASFEERAFEYLAPRVRRPATPEADQELRRDIQRGIADAKAVDITREVDVIRYLELTLGLGKTRLAEPRFQWIDDYLQERSPAEERRNLIAERLMFDTELRR